MSAIKTCAFLFLFAAFAFPALASTFTSTSFNSASLGYYPRGQLVRMPDGSFYGATSAGGRYNRGIIFKLTPAGAISLVVDMPGSDGANNATSLNFLGSLVLDPDGNIWGMAYQGGTSNFGYVFKMTPAGVLTVVYNFTDSPVGSYGGLILGSDGNFYGTRGAVAFRMTTAGVLTNLVTFAGGWPRSPLFESSDGNLYGVSSSTSAGRLYRLTPAGVLTYLADLPGVSFSRPVQDSSGNFYGTTSTGGSSSLGTIFKVTPAGAVTTLYSFAGTGDGGSPRSGLYRDAGGNLYGTTDGLSFPSTASGTLFKFSSGGVLTVLRTFKTNPMVNAESGGFVFGTFNTELTLDPSGNLFGLCGLGDPSSSNNLGTFYKIAPASGDVFTALHLFIPTTPASPRARLTQANDGNFYGAGYWDATGFRGGVFKFTMQGQLSELVGFPSSASSPQIPVIQGTDGSLYGTAAVSGALAPGTVYKTTLAGAFSTVHNLDSATEGNALLSGLIQGSDGNYYGTANTGGPASKGTVFKITPAGVVTVLTSFSSTAGGPVGPVIQTSDGNFYGTSAGSGSSLVYKLTPGGTLTTLADLTTISAGTVVGGLIQATDGNFYGMTTTNVYKVTPAGVLTSVATVPGTLNGELLQASDGNFYGTTAGFGTGATGTLFKVTLAGAVTTLFNFSGISGEQPLAGLIQGSDGALYGTTKEGGLCKNGTVFRLALSSVEQVTFGSSSDLPISAANYTITGSALALNLGFAPTPGTILTVIQNYGNSITGSFTNLPDGGTISAGYNGATYTFTASYSGGSSGHDLTLTLSDVSYPTDTPLLPPWALLALMAGLIAAARRQLMKARA